MARSRGATVVDETGVGGDEPDDDDGALLEPDADDVDADRDDDDDTDDEPDSGKAAPLEGENLQRALEIEHGRRIEHLRAIFGAEFDAFEECPLCHFMGVVMPESVMLDPETERCPKCRGYGVFVTESLVPEHSTRQCPQCLGNGHIPKAVAPPPVAYTQPSPAAPAAAQVQVPPMPIYDPTTNTWRDQSGNPLVAGTGG